MEKLLLGKGPGRQGTSDGEDQPGAGMLQAEGEGAWCSVEGGGGVPLALPPFVVSFPSSTHRERGSHRLGPTPLELGAWHRDSQRQRGRPKPAPLYWRGHLVASLSLHFLLCKLGATAAASKGCRDYSRVSVKLNDWHQVGGKRWLLVYELINIPQQVLPHPWGN